MLFARGSAFTASMLRDIEAGGRVEADHIVGDMLRHARAAGADARLLAAAYCHLQAYEARRARGAAGVIPARIAVRSHDAAHRRQDCRRQFC